MTQQTSPFLDAKYGWSFGESGWNSGMDENLLKFSYLFDSNVDSIVSSLPNPVNGTAYFLTTENRIYFVVGGAYYSTPIPKWFQFKLKLTGQVYQYDGLTITELLYQTKLPSGTTSQYLRGDLTFQTLNKSSVGLSSVDNTSDINKPISNSTQSALDLKSNVLLTSTTVDNIVALKALNTTSNKYATRLGYSTAGDGGFSFWRFDPTSSLTPDDFMVISPNSGTGRWLLNHDGRISVKVAGAVGDGSTDDYAAILKAHTAYGMIYYPPGNYICSSKVLVNAPFGMIGSGINKTIITFTGASQGFSITQSNATLGIVVDNTSFRTNSSSTSNTAIIIDGSSQFTSSDGTHQILGARTENRCRISNVDFRGTADSFGFGVGLNLKSIMNFSTDNITYRGVIPSVVGNLQGIGILVNGDGVPVDFSIRRTWIYYALYSILLPDYIEGGHIYDYEFVAVTNGIYGKYVSGYSVLPEAATGCLAMYIGQGHINCILSGIVLAKTNQSRISQQNIYLQTRATDTQAIGIQLSSGNYNTISDCHINGDQAANTKTNNLGISLVSVGLSSVHSVSASSLSAAATLATSSGNNLDDLLASACTNIVNGDSGSISNKFSTLRANSITGSRSNVALDNNISLEEYAVISTQTFTGQSGVQIVVPLPVGTFTAAPIFGTAVANNGSISFNIQYQYSSSSATSARFFVSPAAPATTLPSASVSFSINLKGL